MNRPGHRARHRAGARPEDRARSGDSVQRDGIAQPADSAQTGAAARARWGVHWRGQHAGGRRAEPLVVPRAQADSYYGRPIIKQTVWGSPQIPGYFFLGGLAGASSVLAGVADLTGNRELARAAKVGAAGAIGLSAVALVHDLGRPLRFLNMLRVAKITSPMSVGTWLISAYGPAAGAAAACAVTGRLPKIGTLGTAGAAAVGTGVCTYTAALVCDTAVPAWHEAQREMPYLFAGSAATAAGGFGMLAVPTDYAGQAIRFAVLGAATELTATSMLLRRLGDMAEPYQIGRAGKLTEAGEVLTAAGLAGAVLAGRSRLGTVVSGAALMAASALTRFGVFEAGRTSARDPKYVVGPQRERLAANGAGRKTTIEGQLR